MDCVLVVDDDPAPRELLEDLLSQEGYKVLSATNGLDGKALAETILPDVVLSDLKMPGMDGLELLDACMRLRPAPAVLMVTGYATVDTAVEALKRGAYDYIMKPFRNAEILCAVKRCLELRRLWRENQVLKRELGGKYDPANFVVASEAMQRVVHLAEMAGPSGANVLIRGETGTGKEVIARLIHSCSPQKEGSFVAVNCAALSENLLESEIFGHVKGAFTGAVSDKEGLFDVARGGSLFLDEVGEMKIGPQSKLLRVIDTGEFSRVGEAAVRHAQVRIIAATHRDLPKGVADGSFREDLFYRLGVFTIDIPPLRERVEDIVPLCRSILGVMSRQRGHQAPEISEEALERLQRHPWPGNVRELENVLQRALILSRPGHVDLTGLIGFEAAPESGPASATPRLFAMPYNEAKQELVDDFERQYVILALESTQGNVSAAAERSGLSRQSLQKVMKRHGIAGGHYKP